MAVCGLRPEELPSLNRKGDGGNAVNQYLRCRDLYGAAEGSSV